MPKTFGDWLKLRWERGLQMLSHEVLQFAIFFGVEEIVSAVVIGLGDEDFSEAIKVEFVAFGFDEFLGGGDAVFLEHGDEEFGVYEGAGVEEFHAIVSGQWSVVRCIVDFRFGKDKVFATFATARAERRALP
jgi:hypothetical protein